MKTMIASLRIAHLDNILITLQMELLLWSASKALLDLVRFADSKVADGTMSKNRLILPGMKRLRKWIMTTLTTEENTSDEHFETSDESVESDILGVCKDPEHLSPKNKWEAFGDSVRSIPRVLRSKHSAFGFRVACAVMSISIVAYLRDSAHFFVVQR